jgi:hypothetical protein
MLTDPKLIKAETITFNRDLNIFLKHRMGAAPVIIDRHHKHAELHRIPPFAVPSWQHSRGG